jgi:hypothetical protein
MTDIFAGGTTVAECDSPELPVARANLPDGWDNTEDSPGFPGSRLPGGADFIDTASDDSFPASDAPTWATGRARRHEATHATPTTPDR